MSRQNRGRARVVLLMGVCGSGKTTLGRSLATRLGWVFLDADDLHSPEARAEMTVGRPLDDRIRTQWIERVGLSIKASLERSESVVLACSALRAKHRQALTTAARGDVVIAHLQGSAALIADRLRKREGHFAGVSLLESQIETLESPQGVLDLDISCSPEALVDQLVCELATGAVPSD
ncbi:MAG: gluconokinase [Myxococcota bacterium]